MVFLAHVPVLLGQVNEQYTNCSTLVQCGSFPGLGYPFWGGNRPDYCGHPSFRLNCQTDSPIITIQTTQYRVLKFNNRTKTMGVVEKVFQDSRFCPLNPQNNTLDPEHFEYTPRFQELTMYYGCQATGNVPIPNQFPCSSLGADTFAVFVTDGLLDPFNGSNSPLTCGPSIKIRVDRTIAPGLQTGATNPVNITQVLESGFGLFWEANNTDCDACDQSGGRCGSNSGSFACYCEDQLHPLTCNSNQKSPGSSKGLSGGSKLGLGFAISIPGAVLLIAIIYFLKKRCPPSINILGIWKKKKSMEDQFVNAFIEQYGSLAPKKFSYSEIKKMTKSFKEKLGQGGYGSVYRGKLSDGRFVAVKLQNETKGNGEEFINEVASISRTSHVNVVALLGFCYKGKQRALVYEFMPKGSLDKFIPYDSHLEWATLYKIAVGVAQGLEYLHRGCGTRIVHFDIKPHNILLDDDFCPKISDFGLAKLCKRQISMISMLGMRGTAGYIAPEVISRTFGEVSSKSDVYSYGMLVLEMVGARKDVRGPRTTETSESVFPNWIYKYLEEDKNLAIHLETAEEEEEEMRKLILVGLWCIQTNPSDRPPMYKVLQMLEESLESLEVPPKPFLIAPPVIPGPSLQDPSFSLSTVNKVIEDLEGIIQTTP